MNAVMLIFKYAFLMIMAMILEYILLVVYNGISKAFTIPSLPSSVLVITLPLTAIIFFWLGWKNLTEPQEGEPY